MSSAKYISHSSLGKWFAELAKDARVLTPTRQGAAVVVAEYTEGAEVCFCRTTGSPKGVVTPACETLVRYKREKNLENLEEVSLKIEDAFDTAPTVLVGVRPCDARGIAISDNTYLNGKYRDPYYAARRNALTVITLACSAPESTCFCNWVGSSPDAAEGSDVLLTAVEDGYVVEACTPKGESMLKASVLEDGTAKTSRAQAVRKNATSLMPEKTNIAGIKAALDSLFDNAEFWAEMSDKCISCGACTFTCPTCTCFNMVDEGSWEEGVRVRTWDSCMSNHFTREASGHNPRMVKGNRWRNRTGHKFNYFPALNKGVLSCTGCGRCVKVCPTGVDIRTIVTQACVKAGACNLESAKTKPVKAESAKAKSPMNEAAPKAASNTAGNTAQKAPSHNASQKGKHGKGSPRKEVK